MPRGARQPAPAYARLYLKPRRHADGELPYPTTVPAVSTPPLPYHAEPYHIILPHNQLCPLLCPALPYPTLSLLNLRHPAYYPTPSCLLSYAILPTILPCPTLRCPLLSGITSYRHAILRPITSETEFFLPVPLCIHPPLTHSFPFISPPSSTTSAS